MFSRSFLAACLFFVGSAQAAEPPKPKFSALNSTEKTSQDSKNNQEIRLGALLHGIGSPEKPHNADVNVEWLSPFLSDVKNEERRWFVPRFHVGGTLNFSGNTSMAYTGFSWQYYVLPKIFGEFSFGGAIHDGKLTAYDPKRALLGCRFLFRESLSLGYDITQDIRIMGTTEHISNGKICDKNRGLTHYGIRVGYSF